MIAPAEFHPEDHIGLATTFAMRWGWDGNRQEAMQNALLGMWRAWQKFDATKAKFSTYAGIWAKGFLLRPERRPMAVPLFADISEDACLEHDDTTIAQGEAREEVGYAMQGLTARKRQIVQLSFLDGVDNTQIGKRLNISRERVRQLKAEALAHMRERLRRAHQKVG